MKVEKSRIQPMTPEQMEMQEFYSRKMQEIQKILSRSERFATVEEAAKYIKDRFVLRYTFDCNGNDKELSLFTGEIILRVPVFSNRVYIDHLGNSIGILDWEAAEEVVEHLFDEFYDQFMRSE